MTPPRLVEKNRDELADERMQLVGRAERAEAELAKAKQDMEELSVLAGRTLEAERELSQAKAERERMREAIEDLCCQFAYWSSIGGFTTGGLSALENAFDLLGWPDPHPYPSGCCDEPGCMNQADCGTPTPSGYRRVCGDHYAALASEAKKEGDAE